MICKNCGYQIDDNSSFCVNCGATVEAQPQYQQAPQYQQPMYQQPVYQQPVYQQPMYVYEPRMSREYTEFVGKAGSLLSKSITSLILTLVLPFVGFLVGFIMSLTVKGGLGKLNNIVVDENEIVTPKSREDYETAKRKAKSAKTISTVNLWLIFLPFIIGGVLGVVLGVLIALGIYG